MSIRLVWKLNLLISLASISFGILFSESSSANIQQTRKELLTELNYLYLNEKAPDVTDVPVEPTKNVIPTFKNITILGEAHPTNTAAVAPKATSTTSKSAEKVSKKTSKHIDGSGVQISDDSDNSLIFDIPVTYNTSVRKWIKYFQTVGRITFRKWLERSSRYLPNIQAELSQAGLPQDLAYLAMIESGFSPKAESTASAVGIWQFMAPTGNQYGLHTTWWLDERRDYYKSTQAAIWYMTDLYKIFGSWYLVAASYNMGEARVKKLIQRYHTNNFWTLADMGLLSDETKNYVPKVLAAMLIAKAPALYGFREIEYHLPESFEYFHIPGGTDLEKLAGHLGVSAKHLKELNPELTHGYVPRGITDHLIRIPKGSKLAVSDYVKSKMPSRTN